MNDFSGAPQAAETSRGVWRWDAGALALYAGLSVLFIDHGASLTGSILGHGSDPYQFVWFLAWWPFAVSHHLDLFWSQLAWQPLGVAVLWATSVPLLAALAAPLTAAAGPVVSYNLLVLLAPALAAWCMYRFCREFAEARAALVGGFLFGFSTYQMAQASTLNLSFTCLLPCLGWIALARWQGRIGRQAAVALFAAAAVAQFLICIEIFAITAFFAGIGWVLLFAASPGWRPGLVRLLADLLIAAPFVLVVLSPCIVSMAGSLGYVHLPSLWPYFFAASPTGFLIPGQNTLLSLPPLWRLTREFIGDFQEQDTYLGLPLLLVIYGYARARWRAPLARSLTLLLLVLAVFSLGPHLWLGEYYTAIRLPWDALRRLPLLGEAQPVRFALYVAFIAAVIAVLWIQERAPGRLWVGVAACVAIMPAAHSVEPAPVSAFFAPGRVQAVLGPAPRILVLPFAINGADMFWQLENRFGFSQTGGYLGFPPAAMQAYPAVGELFGGQADALVPAAFARFVTAMGTQYVVAGPGTPPALLAKVATLGWPERRVDDVTIFDVPKGPATHG
jgi:hypothetical protein